MNIICSKQKLQEGISIVTKAITGKTTMPVLEGIYIKANKEGLTLIGSDMDVSIETKVEADVIKEGSIVIDSKIFAEIIRKLPNSDVKIEIAENDLIQITCEKSVFNLVCMNPSDYPALPSINEDLNVEVPQNLLKNMIKGTSFAIAQDEARPILQGILFEVKNRELNLVDSKIFAEIIRKLPNSDVKIEIAENDLIQITCEKSVFNLVCMNPSDYPALPSINEDLNVEVPQNLLKNMIKGTSFAIAQDEARPILQGILFEVKNRELNLVALDGYRLAVRSELLDVDDNIEVVIPGKTLNEVSKILEDNTDIIKITFTNNHILFNINNTKIISRLLDGKFVNYISLLPQEYKLLVNVKKQELQQGIERASLMAKDGNSNLIRLDVQEDTLVITSNSQLGKVRD